MTFYNISHDLYICKLDSISLKWLLSQMAANILDQIPDMPVKAHESPAKGAGAILCSRLNWDSIDSINALQQQVEFLYEALPLFSGKGSEHWLALGPEEKELITEALREYQKYKQAFCKEEQKKYGSEWGTATDFYTADWADRNEEFLAA